MQLYRDAFRNGRLCCCVAIESFASTKTYFLTVFIFGLVMHLVNGEVVKVPVFVLGGGGELKERKLLQRGQNFDPIDVLQEAVQLKPKPSNMSDFVNYSKHQLLTPR